MNWLKFVEINQYRENGALIYSDSETDIKATEKYLLYKKFIEKQGSDKK